MDSFWLGSPSKWDLVADADGAHGRVPNRTAVQFEHDTKDWRERWLLFTRRAYSLGIDSRISTPLLLQSSGPLQASQTVCCERNPHDGPHDELGHRPRVKGRKRHPVSLQIPNQYSETHLMQGDDCWAEYRPRHRHAHISAMQKIRAISLSAIRRPRPGFHGDQTDLAGSAKRRRPIGADLSSSPSRPCYASRRMKSCRQGLYGPR